MPQLSQSTRKRSMNQESDNPGSGNAQQVRRQSQDSAYGSGPGEDNSDSSSTQYRRADGTMRSINYFGSGSSTGTQPASTTGYFPRDSAYWTDGAASDTRTACQTSPRAPAHFKNFTPDDVASRREPSGKPRQNAESQKTRKTVSAHEGEDRRSMEVTSDLEYRSRQVGRENRSR